MTAPAPTRPSPAGAPGTDNAPSPTPRRGTAIAALAYVGAWAAGLAIPGPRAEEAAGADAVHAVYLDHAAGVLAQATLVHALAGGALAVTAVGIAPALTRRPWSVLAPVAGATAAVLSVGQAVVAWVAVTRAGTDTPAASLALLHSVNILDVAKILLIAVFVMSACLGGESHRLRAPWFVGLGLATAAALVVGSLAFVVAGSALLSTLLAVSLILLLAWMSALAWSSRSGHPAGK